MSEYAGGRLLVATPTLYDPKFFRTVVFVLEHGADGALGVVINRPSETGVAEALPAWSLLAAPPTVVFLGGPVLRESAIGLARAHAVDASDGWLPLFDNLGTVDLARPPDEIRDDFENIRIFAGHAGWSAGQLDSEIGGGGWFVVDAEHDDPFAADPGELWTAVLRRQRGQLAMFANAPPHPSLN